MNQAFGSCQEKKKSNWNKAAQNFWALLFIFLNESQTGFDLSDL